MAGRITNGCSDKTRKRPSAESEESRVKISEGYMEIFSGVPSSAFLQNRAAAVRFKTTELVGDLRFNHDSKTLRGTFYYGIG